MNGPPPLSIAHVSKRFGLQAALDDFALELG